MTSKRACAQTEQHAAHSYLRSIRAANPLFSMELDAPARRDSSKHLMGLRRFVRNAQMEAHLLQVLRVLPHACVGWGTLQVLWAVSPVPLERIRMSLVLLSVSPVHPAAFLCKLAPLQWKTVPAALDILDWYPRVLSARWARTAWVAPSLAGPARCATQMQLPQVLA